MAEMIELLL